MPLNRATRVFGFTAGGLLLSGLAVISVTQHGTIVQLRAQQRSLEAHLSKMKAAPGTGSESPLAQGQDAELERLRESNKDLLRLRNEVTQLRQQLAELEILRDANAKLLQAVQGARTLQSNQVALITSARKQGAILGVTVQPAPAGQSGIVVTSLDQTSPVANSGILPGDLIYALNGRPMQSPGQLQAEMLTHTPGETVLVDVLRTNTPMRFQVQTRAWPQ